MIPPNQPQVPSLPPFFYSTLTAHPVPTLPTTSAEGANPSAAPNPPPPVPPRNSKTPIRQAASLPLSAISDAMTSTANAANQVVSNIQQLARRISRKKNPAPVSYWWTKLTDYFFRFRFPPFTNLIRPE